MSSHYFLLCVAELAAPSSWLSAPTGFPVGDRSLARWWAQYRLEESAASDPAG